MRIVLLNTVLEVRNIVIGSYDFKDDPSFIVVLLPGDKFVVFSL